MQLQNFYAQDANGNIVPGAVCSLFLSGTTTLATGLQDANGAALSNPFPANSGGLIQVAAPDGKYDLSVSAGVIENSLPVTFVDTVQLVSDAIYQNANKVFGPGDSVIDSSTGKSISTIRNNMEVSVITLCDGISVSQVNTIKKQVGIGYDLSIASQTFNTPVGSRDCSRYTELKTLTTGAAAETVLDTDGNVVLKYDTVNKVISSEYEIEYGLERLPPTLFVKTPPRLERNTNDPAYRLANRVYQATPTIERTGPTRYWTAWRADNTVAAEAPGNFTVLAYSDDNCQTVQEYGYLTYSPESPQNHMVDPMLWSDPQGRLWCFFGVMGNNEQFDGVQGTWAVICQNPNAEFPVWGKAFRLSYFGDPRHPVQVNGKWYIAIDGWRHSAVTPPRYMEYVGPRIHLLDWANERIQFVSKLPPNNGTSYSGFFETEFIQTSNGDVLALCRSLSSAAETLYCTSTDMMKTWSAWQNYMAISPSSSSRMWLGRSPSGRTVFCWNNDLIRRTLTLGLSDDSGATYPYKVVLEPSTTGQVSYPVVSFGDNGEIFIIYDKDRVSADPQIRIAKVIEQEVVAGTSVPVVYIVSDPANP